MLDFIELSTVLLDLDWEGRELLAKLRGLHSLLDINMSDISIHAYHASYFDFPRDSTCSDISIYAYHASFLEFLRDSTRSG
jgi:hypothetical protein